jgi:hypothetical protein
MKTSRSKAASGRHVQDPFGQQIELIEPNRLARRSRAKSCQVTHQATPPLRIDADEHLLAGWQRIECRAAGDEPLIAPKKCTWVKSPWKTVFSTRAGHTLRSPRGVAARSADARCAPTR